VRSNVDELYSRVDATRQNGLTVADQPSIDLAVRPAQGFVGFDRIGDRREFALFLGSLRATLQLVGPPDQHEFAVKNKIARHEALVLLVKSGLAGVDMAERLSYRQAALELDIVDALEPIKSRRAPGGGPNGRSHTAPPDEGIGDARSL
jgi:hypothetical protein